MTFETLTLEVKDRIATVSVNRPKALNAINRQVLEELILAFSEIRKLGREVGGVIVTGAGDKAFVAGADIATMKDMTALDAEEFTKLGHCTMRVIETCDVPVIAAVNGFALGGGMELALACDFIYASKNAKLGLPEVNLGLFPGFGGTQRLARLIGRARAKEMVYSADIISADQAFALGVVNKVCDQDKLLDEVRATLSKIMSKAPIAVQLAKKCINEGTDLPLASGLAFEQTQFSLTFATDDRHEGVAAFLEKRPANFKGK